MRMSLPRRVAVLVARPFVHASHKTVGSERCCSGIAPQILTGGLTGTEKSFLSALHSL